MGNPPYDGFAGVAVDEERALTTAYRTVKNAPPPEGQGLNNLFVRFFRMAERRIVEKTGKGIVCFISPYTWLDGRSFTGMRERYLEAFDRIWVDSLNGDKFKTGKLTPEGEPDPSIFSTELNREGIQVGTSIALLVRKESHAPTNAVLFRDFWGKEKRSDLLVAVIDNQPPYEMIEPVRSLGLPFTPLRSEGEYDQWPALPELFPVSFPGVQTSRDDVVVEVNREQLIARMEKYFDPNITDEQICRIAPGAMESTSRFDAVKVREYLLKRGFLPENIVPHVYRPFDLRWLYWEPETKLLDEKRAEYFSQVFEGNIWIGAVSQNRKEFNPPLVASRLCSRHVIERGANLFPLWLRPRERRETLDFEPSADQSEERPVLNLSPGAIEYLSSIGTLNDAEALFYHVIAVLHSPAYACENSGALRQNWPRIPLPAERDALLASAAIGQQIAVLLNTEMEVQGITVGKPRQELRLIAKIRRIDAGVLGQDTSDLKVNASWGYRNPGGAVMPGRGRVDNRIYTSEELAAMELETNNGAEAFSQLGETTYDVYLNENVIWQNVPSNVWYYTIGGYQVIKKWLSFREHKVLGRALSLDELQEVTKIARRIAALLLLRPILDANYLKIKCTTF